MLHRKSITNIKSASYRPPSPRQQAPFTLKHTPEPHFYAQTHTNPPFFTIRHTTFTGSHTPRITARLRRKCCSVLGGTGLRPVRTTDLSLCFFLHCSVIPELQPSLVEQAFGLHGARRSRRPLVPASLSRHAKKRRLVVQAWGPSGHCAFSRLIPPLQLPL